MNIPLNVPVDVFNTIVHSLQMMSSSATNAIALLNEQAQAAAQGLVPPQPQTDGGE